MHHAHSRSFVLVRFVVSFALICLLAGCVTQGRYDELQAERDQLSAESASLRQQNEAIAARALSLRGELALRDREVAQLEREQAELADEVARWAIRGAIRMQLLADGLHITLPHDVLFESGSAFLSDDGEALVGELVVELGQQPYQIAVLGFSDNVPVGPQLADRYPSNWELAGARAASVVRVIEREGIPAGQLLAISRGETGAIASNDTPEGRAENRRIDIRIRPVFTQE